MGVQRARNRFQLVVWWSLKYIDIILLKIIIICHSPLFLFALSFSFLPSLPLSLYDKWLSPTRLCHYLSNYLSTYREWFLCFARCKNVRKFSILIRTLAGVPIIIRIKIRTPWKYHSLCQVETTAEYLFRIGTSRVIMKRYPA